MSHMNGNGTEPKIGAANGAGRAEPDPEVTSKPRRRQYTAEHKLRILAEVEACTKPGEIGALLRREGLYSSALDKWRKQRKRGVLLPAAQEHVLAQDDGKRRLERAVIGLSNAFALAIPHDKAQEMREAKRCGQDLGLSEDEIAFYDALEANDSAVRVLGDGTLRLIAQELLHAVRSNVTIDWTVRETVRAQMRVIIKRILRRCGYPPDRRARATELVLKQAKVLACE